MKLVFSVCDLTVMGYYLERTLHPVEGKLAPIRNIVYGTGSKFTVTSTVGERVNLVDAIGNRFIVSDSKLSTLFEEI